MNRKIVVLVLTSMLFSLVGTVNAQRQYHLEHEWVKIWINQDGTIDLCYDVSLALDSGLDIDFVYIGQPKGYFSIRSAMDQYGHVLRASDESSGDDYRVRVDLYSRLTAGNVARFNLTTNVAYMIYEDPQNPGNVGMQFTPTWWSQARVLDLRVSIVLPSNVNSDIIKTSVAWDDVLTEPDGRLAVHWERQNLEPDQRYSFAISFPKEFQQNYVRSAPLFELLDKEVTKFQGGVNVTLTFRNYGFDATSGTVWIPWEKVYYSALLRGGSSSRNISETLLQFDVNGDGDTSDVFTIRCIDNKTVEIDGVTAHSMFLPEQRVRVDMKLIYDVMEMNSFVLGSRNFSLYRVLLPEYPWDFGYAGFGVDSFFHYHPSPNIEFVIEQKATSINSSSTAEIISVELNGTLTPREFNWITPCCYEQTMDKQWDWYVENTYVYPLGFLNNGSTFTVHLSIRGEPGSYSLLTLMNWAPDTLHRYRYVIYLSQEYANEIPFTIRTSEPAVGVETGDWIKYDYTTVGAPPGTPLPQWLKMEFVSVEGATANVRVTMHTSDGTEQSQTMVFDIASGSGTSTAFSGFVILANLTTGDSIYMSGYGNVMVAGETAVIYAGANRTVVYASLSQAGTQLTYYWDKQTGVLAGASAISGNVTATLRATETNMWQAQYLVVDLNTDGNVDIHDIAIAASAFGSYPGHPRWNPTADINKDDKVNIIDVVSIARNFGRKLLNRGEQ